jgi:RNA polymerase sigma-70 factor (ECF subfamily)
MRGEGEVPARQTAESVARRSYGKLIALLAVRTHDVARAEDALADAFAEALAHWPSEGCPSNPEGWLLATARRKALDAARRRRTAERATTALQMVAEAPPEEATVPDHRLALMFACAHPAIDAAVRAPLMLQVVLGFDAKRIASAFLTSPGTMGQRLWRAKTKIRQASIPLRVPERSELPTRLEAVLDAIYAVFAEGWANFDGSDVVHRDLSEEALFLGRLVTDLVPDAAEARGLLALMLYIEARRGARRSADGAYVPLSQQDPTSWPASMIEEAESQLRRAHGLGPLGRYQVEAALQSAHIHRRRTGTSNWEAVLQLYDALLALTDSPVVAMNRALAVAELHGADAGLETLSHLRDPRLEQYQPYWAALAQLLADAERPSEARHAYDVAIGLERDPAVRRFLQDRRRALGDR